MTPNWMRWLAAVFAGLLALLLLVVMSKCDGKPEGNWPIEAADSDHPIANNLGEPMAGETASGQRVVYQHFGLDILANHYPNLDAPFAIVTVGGTVHRNLMNLESTSNFVRILSADGAKYYDYAHLEAQSVPAALQAHFNQHGTMLKGERIAQIRDVFPCDLDHLHYQAYENATGVNVPWLNPLAEIQPKPDTAKPVIAGIHVATTGTGSWEQFQASSSPGACPVVSGDVNIIVEASDRDDANLLQMGTTMVGVYNFEWRACKSSNPNCQPWNQTHKYDIMPAEWSNPLGTTFGQRFSTDAPWETKPEKWVQDTNAVCPMFSDTRIFTILSKSPGTAGWLTNTGYPDGTYTLSVRATDIAGNVTEANRLVCVQNAGGNCGC